MNESDNGKKIINSMLSVSGIVILAKILGFIKQMMTASTFGATIYTDIISLSEGLISNVDYLLIQALSTAFIPVYIYANKKGEREGKRFVSNTIKVFLLIAFAISILIFAFSSIVAKILAPTYTKELTQRLSLYIKIFSPALVLIVELAIFNSLLKANKKFAPGELIGFNQSVILIVLVLFMGNEYGPDTLVVAFYCYAVFNLIFLAFYSRDYWDIERGHAFYDLNIRKLLKMMGPLLLGYSVVFVNQQVDKIIVSGFEVGTVTAMNYASVLSNFVTTFIGSICSILFTYVTQDIAEGKDNEAASLITTSVIQMITLFIPISILAVLNATDIVQVVFGRGSFDADAVKNCSIAFGGYSCMFVPFIIRELYSRFQYGYEDAKKPMVNSTVAIAINIIFSITLSKIMGVLGVTLATSISVAVCGMLNYRSSKKKNPYIRIRGEGSIIVRWMIGIVFCIVVSSLGKILMVSLHSLVRLILIASVSIFFYGVATLPIIKPLFHKIITR